MADQKVLQLWARNQGKSLRSGSLFNQPVAVRVDNTPVGAEAPDGRLAPEEGMPVRAACDFFFVKDATIWKSFKLGKAGSPPREKLPSRFVKADRNSPGSADLLQWDADMDFFYLSPVGGKTWKRISLYAGGVPRKDLRTIPFLNGGALAMLAGGRAAYLGGDAPDSVAAPVTFTDGTLVGDMTGKALLTTGGF